MAVSYPLSTLAPTISATGIYCPPYVDILNSLIASYQNIFGSDTYIAPDSQDGQWLAIFAQAQFDANTVLQAVFLGQSPASAVGAHLASIVKINGIQKKTPSFSQAPILITGQAFVPINNGVVADTVNNHWALPSSVVIPASGQITVTAVCQTPGAINANPGDISIVFNPQPGWQSAINTAAATPGAPTESDAQLRIRQSQSTALPAQTIEDAVIGQLESLTGVVRAQAYRNNTLFPDQNGLPPRSIALVVDGGDAQTVASTIANWITPGVPTVGNIIETVLDSKGVPATIRYYALQTVPVYVLVRLTDFQNYVATSAIFIQQALAQHLNTLAIGAAVDWSDLTGPATLKGTDAVTGTGQTQAQLDAVSATYKLVAATGLATARADMAVTGGPYPTGTTQFTVTNTTKYTVGQAVSIALNSGFYATTVSALILSRTGVPGTLWVKDPVPVNATVPTGALVYVVGDVSMAFTEAATSTTANITVLTTV